MSEHAPTPAGGDHPAKPSGKGGSKLSAKLGQKVGGLPVWAWGGAIFGGLVIAWYLRGRSSGAPAVDPTTGDVLTADTPGTGGAGYSAGSAVPTTTGAGGTDTAGTGLDPTDYLPTDYTDPVDPTEDYTDPAPTVTNASWRAALIASMVTHGNSPLNAEKAAAAYLAGHPLTASQQKMLNSALTVVGARPSPAPAPTYVHTPTHSKPPAPVHKHTKHSPQAHHTAPTHHTHAATHAPAHSTRDTGKAPAHHAPAHHAPAHHPAPAHHATPQHHTAATHKPAPKPAPKPKPKPKPKGHK